MEQSFYVFGLRDSSSYADFVTSLAIFFCSADFIEDTEEMFKQWINIGSVTRQNNAANKTKIFKVNIILRTCFVLFPNWLWSVVLSLKNRLLAYSSVAEDLLERNPMICSSTSDGEMANDYPSEIFWIKRTASPRFVWPE